MEELYKFFDNDLSRVSAATEAELTTLQTTLSSLQATVGGLDDGVTAIRRLVLYQAEANLRFVALESRATSLETRVTAVEQRLVPVGAIIMWSGTLANIPAGWALCDGSGGRPDLRDKFVKGAPASTNPGATGGAVDHTHGIGSLGTDTTGVHQHNFTQGSNAATPDLVAVDTTATGVAAAGITDAAGNHAHSITGTLDAEDHLPPYYEVAFIIKTAV